MVGITEQPRLHHYLFAHRTLPLLYLPNAEKFLNLLKQEGVDFLIYLWDAVGSGLQPSDLLPPTGLKIKIRQNPQGDSIAVITLPTAERSPEAHFVALVHRPT